MGSDERIDHVADRPMRPRTPGRRITDRQAAVLALITDGLANKQIAERLGLAEQTVKGHVSHLLSALSVSNRAALVEAATQFRLFGTFDVQREWLGLLFEESPMYIAVFTGPDHVFVAANAAFRQAAAGRELIGRSFREAFPDLEETGLYEQFDLVFREQRRVVLHELPSRFDRHGDGIIEDGYWTTVMHPLPVSDSCAGGVAVLSIDVTEQVWQRGRETPGSEVDDLAAATPS
jgi:DNA-binding CsgD family transcriptional regulator